MSREEDIERMKQRTRVFALSVIGLVAELPSSTSAKVLGKQILRSGTSVGAQYRESCRAKSNADFITKIEGCLQELEETRYWLEILFESKIIEDKVYRTIDDEANQLIAIFTTVVKKVKSKS